MGATICGSSFVCVGLALVFLVIAGEIDGSNHNQESNGPSMANPNAIIGDEEELDTRTTSDSLRSFLSRRSNLPSSNKDHQQKPESNNNNNWSEPNSLLTPSPVAQTPKPCHVEIQFVERRVGFCTRLAGGRINACKAPGSLQLYSPECY